MNSSSNLPWTKIHEFLLDVGNVREPKNFCVKIIRRIHRLIPYDQARIYFMDDTGKIVDEFLLGVEQRWSDVYREHYSKMRNSYYTISADNSTTRRGPEKGRYLFPRITGAVYDWADRERDEFITDYIMPQRLSHSAGFVLYNTAGLMKSVCCLDRTSRSGYERKEIDTIATIQPHLDNLHRNLFVPTAKYLSARNPEIQERLTNRELEIATLLCRGMTPARISNHLCLSLSTTYTHIANMHKKLGVSNRQELLLTLMNSQ